MPRLTHALRTVTLFTVLAPLGACAARAQRTAPLPPAPSEAPEPPRIWPGQSFVFTSGAADRGYLGVTPDYASGPADTLGILLEDVEDGLAAHKAGIRRGDRLVSIDGIDLRVEPGDIGDRAAEALPESRLRRVLTRKEAGDTVTVVVYSGGRKDTKQVVLSESPMARTLTAFRTANTRRVLGLSFSQRGSMRDTAGLLIISISSGGAADKAGLNEGDRIVSIDGIDLRVPSSDAGTSDGVEARISRLRRALDAAKDSQPVRFEVLTDGRRRTVTATPTAASGFTFSTANLENMANDVRATVRANIAMSGERAEIARARAEASREQARMQREMVQGQREMQRELAQGEREMQRELAQGEREMQRELQRGRRFDLRLDDDNDGRRREDARGAVRGTIRGRTDGATLVLSGLSLAAVDRDFAQQFGKGSEDGALVVRTRREWEPIRTGDVILSVDGRSVRDGNSLDISFDRSRDQRLEILRGGRKETITLPATR